MINHDLNDTIAAISTPVGEGGIGIVRLSGKGALKIADKIFFSKDGKEPSDYKTYTTHYGWVRQNAKVIDEVLLTVMRAPKSYTKEDIVEINCHGGIVALRRVLDLALESGCRLAEPGEFTKRAFLNGRIDLAQAEAVLDVIRAKTDAALRAGTEQLRGALSGKINNLREKLLAALTVLEAKIDFPEEEAGAPDLSGIRERIRKADDELKEILASAGRGRILREGIQAVICGKPNVGKSSLLNALLRQERSIVTASAGTTRDTIEEIIDIKGIPVRIVDTAGIIEPRDLVEKKAVQRSRRAIAMADLVILLFDASKKIGKDDRLLMRKLKNKTVLAVVNKIDLKEKLEREKIRKIFPSLIGVSAKKMKNISLLEEGIANLVYQGKAAAVEPAAISNLRQIEALRGAQKLVAEAVNSLDNELTAEFVAEGLKGALRQIDGLLGKEFSEDLLDKIFSEFCIGK